MFCCGGPFSSNAQCVSNSQRNTEKFFCGQFTMSGNPFIDTHIQPFIPLILPLQNKGRQWLFTGVQRIWKTGYHGLWDTREGVRTRGRNEVWGNKAFCCFLILGKETSPSQRGKETQVEMEKNGKLRKKCFEHKHTFSVRPLSRQEWNDKLLTIGGESLHLVFFSFLGFADMSEAGPKGVFSSWEHHHSSVRREAVLPLPPCLRKTTYTHSWLM